MLQLSKISSSYKKALKDLYFTLFAKLLKIIEKTKHLLAESSEHILDPAYGLVVNLVNVL